MGETILRSDAGSIIQEILEKLSSKIVLVTTSQEIITHAIEQHSQGEEDKQLSVISSNKSIKQSVSTFSIGATAADLLKSDQLTLLETDSVQTDGTLFVTNQTVISVVDSGEKIAALISDDKEFCSRTSEKYTTIQSNASGFSLRTPAFSKIRTSLEEKFNQSVVDDFEECIHAYDNIQNPVDEIGGVAIALLVAAKHELQLFKISKWGEDVGLGSRATFSRKKGLLEKNELIKTEKIPMDVGRPRLRLILGNEQLKTTAIDELASVANDLLKANKPE